MKKILALAITLISLAPALSLADALSPQQLQIQHLTAITAALLAQEAALSTSQSLACAATVSKTRVQVHEPFALAWGSVGAMNPATTAGKSMWSQNGVSEISIDTPGVWAYSFTFYGAGGNTTSCSTKVIVGAAR